jgi:hypothetical protein
MAQPKPDATLISHDLRAFPSPIPSPIPSPVFPVSHSALRNPQSSPSQVAALFRMC